MARQPNRRPEPANDTTLYTWGLVALLGLFTPIVVLWAAARWTGDTSRDPVDWVLRSITGEASWTTATTVVAIILGLVVFPAAIAAGLATYRTWVSQRSRVDTVAASMSDQSDITPLAEKASVAAATKLGVQPTAGPGVPIGDAVRTGQALWGAW